MRVALSVRSWAFAFALTAGFYLVQTDSERFAAGRWPLMSPWLHTSALSVFAVLSVLVALLHGAVSRWLSDYERYAKDDSRHRALALARRAARLRRRRRGATSIRRAASSASPSSRGLLPSPA